MIKKEMFDQVDIEALERPDHCFGLNKIHFLACATMWKNMHLLACARRSVQPANTFLHNRRIAHRRVANELTDGTAILFVNASQPVFLKTGRIYSQDIFLLK